MKNFSWTQKTQLFFILEFYLLQLFLRANEGIWNETVKELYMNDKVLIITIFSLLGIGFIAILFVAVPWFTNYLLPNWKDTLIDSGIVVVAIILFVYGFYMNTRMH